MPTPRTRPAILLLVACLALSLVGTSVGPATGALPTAKVVWGKVPATAAVGTKVTVRGSVTNGVRGQKLQLQRRTGGAWSTVAAATLPRNRTFSLRSPVALGRNQLRVLVKPVPGKRRGSTSTIKVVQGVPAPGFTVSTLPPAFRNRMYNYFEGFSASGSWDVEISAGSLPPGLFLDEGYLDGTPTVAGTFTFTVRITAPGLPAAQRQFTLRVRPNGAWSKPEYDVQAVDNDGVFASVTCVAFCVNVGPQRINLETGEIDTGALPEDVTSPSTFMVEDISGDGRFVLYFAGGDAAFFENPPKSSLYLWEVGGATVKISDGGPRLWAGGRGGSGAAVDADGSTVAYHLPGDGSPEEAEVFVWERGEGSSSLRDIPGLESDMMLRPEISDDGETVTFVRSNYNHGDQITLLDRTAVTDPLTDVTPPMDSQASYQYSLSADGQAITYPRVAAPDPDDPGYFLWETALWDRATGASQVVSRTVSGAPMRTTTRFDRPTAEVSGDGRFVYFESNGDFLEDDDPRVRLPYFWDRATGAVTPMPLPPDEPTDWPDLYPQWAETSYDGGVVFVRGATSYSSSVYRFDRDPRP